ncbi:unnamed protein product [Callosobruchus maculatus]|uniref:Very long-chain fatty acid transport protein n=3 Tax=Callosobruchus maculatus TaxID=64391 RepID=A0A653CBQ2_CALMS|nr:unnamed protein product [Callosobruchus maculatus]
MLLILTIVFIISWFFLTNRRYRYLYILYKTLPRDLTALIRFGRLKLQLKNWVDDGITIPKVFRTHVSKHPNRVAFHFEDTSWTFQELEDFSNRVANYFIKEGYEKGDSVALLLENRIEYIGLWLGLAKAGVITALINTNLVSLPLHHCITVSHCKAVIYGSDFADAIDGIRDKLQDVKKYEFLTKEDVKAKESDVDLKKELQAQSASCPVERVNASIAKDKLIYIFTSGTTGMPKAAIIPHSRYMYGCLSLYCMSNLNDSDIFYNPLPLYHSAGGIVGVGQCLLFGLTVLIRRKFSASNFWNDCYKHKCTATNYIGETCRYILAAHKKDDPVPKHKVTKMVGNGLRAEIWEEFQKTFNVKQIFEFYGSTEGNANLINIDNTIGAVGFVPPLAPHSVCHVDLIRCDDETKEPLRTKDGLCIRCEPGQPGLMIGRIDPKKSINQFAGYVDRKETNKKILENVFSHGDSYFNTGDVLVKDELGYYYFVDRTGDTYRWKGENVSTTEVEKVVSEAVGLKDCVAYGVEVPKHEGKAGMLAIVDADHKLDKDALVQQLKTHLPSYAIPLFLRITRSVPMTGTFKIKKNELRKEGFSEVTGDEVYFLDMKSGKYVPVAQICDKIREGTLKL